MTDIANIRALLDKATPQLLVASGNTIGRLLRLGADNWDAPDFEHDGETIATLLAVAPALLDELEALRGGWLLIDTAPKDGTRVDLWCDDARYTDCYWKGGPKRGCWWAPNQDYDGVDGVLCRHGATHWRPIPTPPSKAKRHD